MKITVNSKKHEIGKSLDLKSCSLSFEKICEFSGIVGEVTYKDHASGEGILKSGDRVTVTDGATFKVSK
jgi:hypothetical protein